MTKRERIPHTDRFLQTFHAAADRASVITDEYSKIRCGNHGRDFRVYHNSVAEVRACYATHISSPKRAEDAREDWSNLPCSCDSSTNPCAECAGSGRRKPNPPRSSGWWNLPIAASMWRADARAIER